MKTFLQEHKQNHRFHFTSDDLLLGKLTYSLNFQKLEGHTSTRYLVYFLADQINSSQLPLNDALDTLDYNYQKALLLLITTRVNKKFNPAKIRVPSHLHKYIVGNQLARIDRLIRPYTLTKRIRERTNRAQLFQVIDQEFLTQMEQEVNTVIANLISQTSTISIDEFAKRLEILLDKHLFYLSKAQQEKVFPTIVQSIKKLLPRKTKRHRITSPDAIVGDILLDVCAVINQNSSKMHHSRRK